MDIRDALHDALDDEEFSSPALLARAMSRLDEGGGSRNTRWAPIIALALAVAIVVTLIMVRLTLGGLTNVGRPAPTPRGGNVPALSVSANVTGITSYQFISPEVGWLNVSDGTRTVIAKTTDGGQTWHSQLTIDRPFSLSPLQMRFFSANEGFVAGQDGSIPAVWRTEDGGASWQVHHLPSNGQDRLVSAYFLDATQGWVLTTTDFAPPALSGPAYVYRTTDGGSHWAKTGTLDPASRVAWMGIRFVKPAIGFITVSVGSQFVAEQWTAPLPLYATRDGGATWTRTDLTLPPPGEFIEAVMSFSGDTGVLIVEANRVEPCPSQSECTAVLPAGRFLYSTTDGGQTWSGPQTIGHGYVALADAQHWFLLNSANYSVSSDGGKTWSTPRALGVPSHWFATEAQFLDAQRGWVTLSDTSEGNFQGAGAAGPSGRTALLYTADGGSTWQAVKLPADPGSAT